eukprot:gb/GFBE01043921.1/.p1 GENE.gb/GFBE01043921.1/~~gb/GFBE01043921.1/.p1  ORF type:complete len:774 (+),score=149.85 gb/GFBE01043921.1/:1-2322(+)
MWCHDEGPEEQDREEEVKASDAFAVHHDAFLTYLDSLSQSLDVQLGLVRSYLDQHPLPAPGFKQKAEIAAESLAGAVRLFQADVRLAAREFGELSASDPLAEQVAACAVGRFVENNVWQDDENSANKASSNDLHTTDTTEKSQEEHAEEVRNGRAEEFGIEDGMRSAIKVSAVSAGSKCAVTFRAKRPSLVSNSSIASVSSPGTVGTGADDEESDRHRLPTVAIRLPSEGEGLVPAGGLSDDAEFDVEQLEKSPICPNGVMSPNWVGRLVWDFSVIFLVLLDSMVLPYQLSFKAGVQDSFDHFWFYLTTTLFALDVLLNFNTAYESTAKDKGMPPGTLVTRRSKIAAAYLKSWFTIDVLSTVPWPRLAELLTEGGEGGGSSAQVAKLTKIVKFVRFLRLMRMLRLAKLGIIWERIEARMGSIFLLQIIALLRVLFVVIAICHWNACIWWLIGQPRSLLTEVMSDEEQEAYANIPHWTTERRAEFDGGSWRWVDKDQTEAYVFCFYWTLGVMRTMPAEVTPVNLPERIFVLCFMFFALSAFAICVAQITQAFFKFSERRRVFHEEMAAVRMHLRKISCEESTQSRVKAYLRHLFDQRRIQAKEVNLLNQLPESLKRQVRRSRLAANLLSVDIMKTLSQRALLAIADNVKVWDMMPGDRVCTEGELSEACWVLASGRLMAMARYGEEEQLGVVHVVDEDCLLTVDDVESDHTVVAVTACEVIRLSKRVFHKYALINPSDLRPTTFRPSQMRSSIGGRSDVAPEDAPHSTAAAVST